jgi:Domain of unknown function (DUF3291)
VEFHLAELNVARLTHPLDAAENIEFVGALDAINLLAETSAGFVWRLTNDDGRSASYVAAYDDPQLIVNYSVWHDVATLHHFVTRSGHSAYLRRRREWFTPNEGNNMVCWWTPAGEIPPLANAMARLEVLRHNGPSDAGWRFTDPFPQPC